MPTNPGISCIGFWTPFAAVQLRWYKPKKPVLTQLCFFFARYPIPSLITQKDEPRCNQGCITLQEPN
jgi:hypothetical protein